jgi:hypothetical protein
MYALRRIVFRYGRSGFERSALTAILTDSIIENIKCLSEKYTNRMGAVDNAPDAFSGELEALKRRGCTLLVVGPDAGMSRCETLLGDDDRDRTRLVVDTHDGPSPATDSPIVRPDTGDVRSATAASSTAGDDPSPAETAPDAVAHELIARIDRLDADGPEPGQLRVCLGDLGSLAPDGPADMTSFLAPVTERIREASGIGHAHLSDTSPLRTTVEPLVAVTVEVRPVPGGRQQRWLLHEAGLDSGWLPV